MFTPPQGFSQLTAPFIASWSQGIRLVPVLLDFCQVCEDTFGVSILLLTPKICVESDSIIKDRLRWEAWWRIAGSNR